MTYEVSKEVMNEVIKEFAKTAKKLKGDLVVFTSRLEDEYVIRDIKDFENLPKGQMINPVDFCYVIYSHSSFDDCWEMAINQAKENLPTNCKKIYLVSEDSNDTKEKFNEYKRNKNESY